MRFLIFLFCGAALAAPPPARPTQVRIPLWLDGASGEPAADKFHITIDGSAIPVTGVQCPDDDLIILLVLDISSGDVTIMDPAKATAMECIRRLPPNAYVALLRAQDGLHVLEDPTTDRDKLTGLIEEQALSGKTGLLSTVETIGRVADSMLAKSKVRVATLAITDGDVRNYREDFANPVINSSDSHDLSRRFPETLVQEKIAELDSVLASQQAPLFIVDLNPRTDRLNSAYNNGLKQMAETTGGMAVFGRSTTEIPEAVRRTFEAARSHYSITLGIPEHVPARLLIRLSLPEEFHLLSYRSHISMKRR